jgi:glucose/arabinose dehydrogenase
MKTLITAAALLALVPATALAQVNAGTQKPEADLPFTITKVADLKLPWRIAFLPDGRMLVTEKVGALQLVTQTGEKTEVTGVPPVVWQGQGGMLGVFLSPKYATDHSIYLTYSEPDPAAPAATEAPAAPPAGGRGFGPQRASALALARATLQLGNGTASLQNLQVLWRDAPAGQGGQFGAAVAFSPDGQYLFLAVGDRQRMAPAQDPNTEVGKILRLTLDGKPAPGNPNAGKTGASTRPLINPPRNTEVAKTAPVVSTYTLTGPNLAPSETWTSGHRTPYGLAFAPDGRLWEVEHGPRGGDELNLIEPGKNYGWPLVSYATNYDGVPIPSPDTRSDLQKPVIYWTPIIAPGNLMFYKGAMFPQWNGNGFVSGIATRTINRIVFDGKGGATPAERWDVGHQVRDIEVAPDGALWFVENANPGGLYRLTPKQ